MTISPDEVFENTKLYLLSSYPDATDITMLYCSLNSPLSRKRYFRVQLNYHRITKSTRSAIFQVDAESGAIELFKENYTYTYWS